MSRMTAMDAAVSILVDEGVEVIFGIPGAGILGFYQSLMKSGKIKHYVTRHEEGAIFAADGYARAIDKVGVCAATSGPGASNFVTGLYTAFTDSIPIIAITGQNVRSQLGKEAFQAVDIMEIVKPITKKATASGSRLRSRGYSEKRSVSLRKGAPDRCSSIFLLMFRKERLNMTFPSIPGWNSSDPHLLKSKLQKRLNSSLLLKIL